MDRPREPSFCRNRTNQGFAQIQLADTPDPVQFDLPIDQAPKRLRPEVDLAWIAPEPGAIGLQHRFLARP